MVILGALISGYTNFKETQLLFSLVVSELEVKKHTR